MGKSEACFSKDHRNVFQGTLLLHSVLVVVSVCLAWNKREIADKLAVSKVTRVIKNPKGLICDTINNTDASLSIKLMWRSTIQRLNAVTMLLVKIEF